MLGLRCPNRSGRLAKRQEIQAYAILTRRKNDAGERGVTVREAIMTGSIGSPALALDRPLLRVSDLRVAFGGIEAVRGLSIDIRAGQTLGLVGESGCGKSVSWLALLGLLGPEAKVGGSALLDGDELIGTDVRTITDVRGRRIAMVFQDPTGALNPMRSVGWQIDEVLQLHRGMHGREARRETCRLLERVGIPDPARRADAYAHELSGGQNQRIAIAMALAGQPALLVAEPRLLVVFGSAVVP